MKVRYTKSALRQLSAILAYIETHSPQGAQKVQARIARLIGALEMQPFIGVATSKRGVRRAVAIPTLTSFFMKFVVTGSLSAPSGMGRAKGINHRRLV